MKKAGLGSNLADTKKGGGACRTIPFPSDEHRISAGQKSQDGQEVEYIHLAVAIYIRAS
jgi:hypothetical protein